MPHTFTHYKRLNNTMCDFIPSFIFFAVSPVLRDPPPGPLPGHLHGLLPAPGAAPARRRLSLAPRRGTVTSSGLHLAGNSNSNSNLIFQEGRTKVKEIRGNLRNLEATSQRLHAQVRFWGHIQSFPSHHADVFWIIFRRLRAATAASYCPSRAWELPKNNPKNLCMMGWGTL